MKTVAFHNLGCKVNSYELDIMQQILTRRGYKIVPFDEMADIYVINTCTVTNIADRKSRQMLHRAKQKNPRAIVVAVGCYVQTDEEGVMRDDCVDLAIGNNRKKDIGQILEEFLSRRESTASGWDKTLGGTTVIDISQTREYEEYTLEQTAEHTRVYIKIQDGCNQFCSYCAIPLSRGRVRSRRAEDVLKEVRTVVAAGYKEIVLTGIHISSYGIDLQEDAWELGESLAGTDYRGRSKLIDLVEQVHRIPGLERIRIGSLEPRIVTEDTARRLAAMEKVCPHFHLSLQSGCDETLKRMNRHYTVEEYAEGVELLRKAYAPAVPAITTDVIVGFPGETEEEFSASRDFLRRIGFYEMHIFKYSKRVGTRAAVMPHQVPEQIKTERSNALLELAREESLRFRKQLLGKEVTVLLEEKKRIGGREYLLGYTPDYVRIALDPARSGAADCQGESGRIIRVKAVEMLTEEIILGHEIDIL